MQKFKSGRFIQEIANECEPNKNIIFAYLASFVASGQIKVTDFIFAEHFEELKSIIQKYNFEDLSDLKHQLDDKFSYGELRLVLEVLKN
ncbi:helix-turn-helix domain-containing protein [Flavobacteriaceae bacterium GSB9]|nr:helix-turn-helix domain-containing protein [Flavobacteriaceae bacterium GSB9]